MPTSPAEPARPFKPPVPAIVRAGDLGATSSVRRSSILPSQVASSSEGEGRPRAVGLTPFAVPGLFGEWVPREWAPGNGLLGRRGREGVSRRAVAERLRRSEFDGLPCRVRFQGCDSKRSGAADPREGGQARPVRPTAIGLESTGRSPSSDPPPGHPPRFGHSGTGFTSVTVREV